MARGKKEAKNQRQKHHVVDSWQQAESFFQVGKVGWGPKNREGGDWVEGNSNTHERTINNQKSTQRRKGGRDEKNRILNRSLKGGRIQSVIRKKVVAEGIVSSFEEFSIRQNQFMKRRRKGRERLELRKRRRHQRVSSLEKKGEQRRQQEFRGGHSRELTSTQL